ncbi:murein hydrolase activator EnvC family protein [Sporolactobacillus terrae]|uniref:murein hydrolase activator EnvC family protein n=1 Tax=Sporolactobacillus terrae TaxID=269673 RepID=UPI00048BD22E|nr:M23 family metallopeptidase [Sporolactobacillus terrae]
MNVPKLKIVASVCLSCSLVLSVSSGPVFAATTQSQLKDKLNTIQDQKQKNKENLSKSKQKLSKNQNKQDTVVEAIKATDKKISTLNGRISSTQTVIDQNKLKMEQLKKTINKINQRIDARGEILRGRIRTMYISGGAVNYLDVLMGAKSFGNFLDRLLALKMITDQDNRIINDQKKDKQVQQNSKEKLQNVLAQTTNALHNLTTMKTSLDKENNHKQGLLKDLQNQADDIEKTVFSTSEQHDILSAQESVVKKQLDDLAAAKAKAEAEAKAKAEAEAKAKTEREAAKAKAERTNTAIAKNDADSSTTAAADSDSNQSSGTVENAQQTSAETVSSANTSAQFIRPAAGYISSGFGYRSFDHGFHPGIDIANSTGTPIHAAADGIVFRAYQSSSYGNCIMISHVINGQLMTTVYAHLSAINVSEGQSVSQGQTIGAMGSTGESFGSHLHFEVYNGRWTPPPHNGAVNPLNYIN